MWAPFLTYHATTTPTTTNRQAHHSHHYHPPWLSRHTRLSYPLLSPTTTFRLHYHHTTITIIITTATVNIDGKYNWLLLSHMKQGRYSDDWCTGSHSMALLVGVLPISGYPPGGIIILPPRCTEILVVVGNCQCNWCFRTGSSKT